MNKNKFAAFTLGASLAAFAVGCSTTPTTSNANGNTVPSNVAVATNNNGNTNTAGVMTTNTAGTTNMNGDFNTRYGRDYNYNVGRPDFDRTADEYGREAKTAGYNIGSGVQDRWIHFKTRGALLGTNDLRESTINVDVDNNVVTLRGTVASAAQKNAAAKVAMGIDGVKSVTNSLVVSANDSVLTPGTGNANGNMNSNNRNGNMNMNR